MNWASFDAIHYRLGSSQSNSIVCAECAEFLSTTERLVAAAETEL